MIFTSYTKSDTCYEFVTSEGNKVLFPISSVILTDDESGLIAIKLTATRKTMGLLKK